MKTLRLILLPGVGIPRQKSPYIGLVVPRPQVNLPRLLIIVLPTVTKGILILPIWLYFISKRVTFINLIL